MNQEIQMRKQRDQDDDEQEEELVDRTTVRAPLAMAHVRVIDIVGCPNEECGVVLHLHNIEETEEREISGEGALNFFKETVEGVFCPHCEQLLFDRKTWVKHLAARHVYDEREDFNPNAATPAPAAKATKRGKDQGAEQSAASGRGRNGKTQQRLGAGSSRRKAAAAIVDDEDEYEDED
jgi:hypothetical protein